VSEAAAVTERERVEGWRFHRFVELGFDHATAKTLSRSTVDVYAVIALLAAGCDHPTAARILL